MHRFLHHAAFTTACLLPALLLSLSCGTKAPPAGILESADTPPATPPATPAITAPEAPVESPAAAPAPARDNADLRVTVGHADGVKKAGKVRRIEKSSDWFGEADWLDTEERLVIVGENAGKEDRIRWQDVRSLTISVGKGSDDMDCSYDSNFTPWMYDCTLRTTCKLTSVNGKTYDVTSREKWRFTFEDGTTEEFWLVKYPAREQDEAGARIEDEATENYEIYEKLQARIRTEVKKMVTTISVGQ